MYRLLAFLAFLTLPAVALAQFDAFNCSKSAAVENREGQQILGRIQARYNTINSIQADFRQHSFLTALEVSESSLGKMWYERPGKMRWSYSKPEKQEFIVRDTVLWFYRPEDNQVLIDQFRQLLSSDVPVGFILGIGDLTKDFKLLESCRKDGGILVKLTPAKASEEEQGVQQFILRVRDTDYVPSGAQIQDAGGNVTSIEFEAITINGTIAESVFASEFPAGTDIVDKRVSK